MSASGHGASSRLPRWWNIAVFAAAILLAWSLRPPYFTDWDSFDYTVAAVRGQPSTLATGRMFFVSVHSLAWQVAHGLFDVQAPDAWHVFRGVTMALAGLAAIAVLRAAWRLTGSPGAGLLAGLLWITAPQAIIYGSAIMTETPAILFLALSVVLTERAVRAEGPGRAWVVAALAGGAFAVAVNMREPMICFALYHAGRLLLAGGCRWRGRLARAGLFAAAFAGIFAAGLLLAAESLGGPGLLRENIRAWRAAMLEERQEYPNVVGENALALARFSALASIAGVAWFIPAIVFAVVQPFVRASGIRPGDRVPRAFGDVTWPPVLWFLLGAAAYLVSLLYNHDLNVNPRFVLPLMLPVTVLCAAALGQAVRRRQPVQLCGLWLFALAMMVLLASCRTWAIVRWLPPVPGLTVETWALTALAAAATGGLAWACRGKAGEPVRLAAACGLVVAFAAAAVLSAWPWIDLYYIRHSRWQKQFVGAITGPSGLPADAMLIPGPGTPAVQYLVWTDQHPGWVLPGPPYDRHLTTAPGGSGSEKPRDPSPFKGEVPRQAGGVGVLGPDSTGIGLTLTRSPGKPGDPPLPSRERGCSAPDFPDSVPGTAPHWVGADIIALACRSDGWVVIPSGWPWPDGASGKAELLDLVSRYLATGRPVYVYGGPSSWAPGKGRRVEWPQIEQLQRTYRIEDSGPGEMCRVLPIPPPPDQPLVPLGLRATRSQRSP